MRHTTSGPGRLIFIRSHLVGAVGVPIPLDASPATIAKLVGSCSGVLLPGSPADVNPQKYGEAPIPECAAPDPAREAVDELLLQDAFNLHKPLLGICYGMQALNVWRGGTLIQHLPMVTSSRSRSGSWDPERASVRLTPGSKLAEFIGADDHDLISITEPAATVVNSSHHQAVGAPGDGLQSHGPLFRGRHDRSGRGNSRRPFCDGRAVAPGAEF